MLYVSNKGNVKKLMGQEESKAGKNSLKLKFDKIKLTYLTPSVESPVLIEVIAFKKEGS